MATMQQTIKDLMHYQMGGLPIWSWLVLWLGGILPTINEWINRSKWTTAQTMWQFFWRGVEKTPASNLPGIAPIIRKMAYPPMLRRKAKQVSLIVFSAAALNTAACGDFTVRFHQSIATAALAAAACRETLSEAHAMKTEQVIELARSGDKAAAGIALNAWEPRYQKILVACKSLKAGAKIALDIASAVDSKDAVIWIMRLANLVAETVKEFTAAGIAMKGI